MKFSWCILTLMTPLFCIAQSQEMGSLEKRTLTSADSNRIDALNKRSGAYYSNVLSETYKNVQTDTAIWLATQALNESVKFRYDRGIAEAFLNFGEIARYRSDFAVAEKYLRQSILLFAKIHALEKYSWAHVTLGYCLYSQGKFSDAKEALEHVLPYYVTTNNKEWQSMLLRMISLTYSARGYNEKAFENTLKAIRITYKISDARGVISSPENMGRLYKDAGNPETALSYFRLAAEKAAPTNPVRYYRLMGYIAMLTGESDSAIYYFKETYRYVTLMTTDSILRRRDFSLEAVSIGEVYMKQKKYNLAIEQFTTSLPFFEKGNDKNNVMRISLGFARCYQLKEDWRRCFIYTERLYKMAKQTGARPYTRDAYELYRQIYEQQGKIDSAYKYSLKYITLKDSILSDEYRRNIALSEMSSQDQQQKTAIGILQKAQEFNKEKLFLQQQQLKSESVIRYVFIAAAVAFVLIGIFVFRTINFNRKNEKQHLQHALEVQQLNATKTSIEFQQQATELEMQALRAQMNPHFIFNCLSSINRYILINKTEEASDYLTKFSRLIRMVLHNSEKTYISLENELEALRLYLDLERLRFKNAFNYSITFVNEIDINAVHIPPMLIQPFAENAIWHGLMHKKEIGSLEIHLRAADKILTCAVVDNGIGRNMAAAHKSRSAEKTKSMGVSITAGRLELLNKYKREVAVLKIEDLVDKDLKSCGTKVILTMPYKDLTEVIA